MKPGAQIVLVNAVQLLAPLILLFAATLLAARAPGGGVGLLAGLIVALGLALYGLLFGPAALRAAFPSWAWRLVLAAGVIAALVGAGAPGWRFAPQTVEAGLTAAAASAGALIVMVLFGRVPTLRDAEW